MNRRDGKRTPPEKTADGDAAGERRRMGRIVHDDRGSASLEWRDAPDDYERPKLEIEGTGAAKPLSVTNDDTFNPYERSPDGGTLGAGKTGKRDLKKLSAWIKLMREMEERKKQDDSED